jgi:radical SAM superfamily enzyme YgiQ (UPF0313 family)
MKEKVLLLTLTLKKGTEDVGICAIAAYLKLHGYEVELHSFELAQLDEGVWNFLKTSAPTYCGISIYDATKEAVYTVCRRMKQFHPECTIIVGGAEAYCNPEEIISEEKCIDYIVSGEGEITLLALLKALSAGQQDLANVNGITFLKDGRIVTTKRRELMESIDELPDMDHRIFVDNNIHVGSIISSRGCRGNCSFCLSPSMWPHENNLRWRGMSVNRVIDQIEYFVNRGIKVLSIKDSSFEDPDGERMYEIAREILKRGYKVHYSVNFRPSIVRSMDQSGLSLLKQSGLIKVFVGIESLNNADLKLYRKGVLIHDNIRVLKFFADNGVNLQFGFINFNPYTTLDGLENNYLHLREIQYLSPSNIYNYCTALKLYAKTALYERVATDNLLFKIDPDGLGYHFADERVGRLSHAIRAYYNEFSAVCAERVATDFADKYIDILTILEKEFENLQQYHDLLGEIKRMKEDTISEIIQNFHKHDFFLNLINLARGDWKESLARDIFMSAYNFDGLKRIVSTMGKNRLKLWKKIFARDEYCRKLLESLL